GTTSVALPVGSLRRPETVSRKPYDLAEADFDAGVCGVVGQPRCHLRAVDASFEVVQLTEIDQRSTRREFVEAEGLQSGAGRAGGGSQSGRATADHNH